MLRRTFLKMLGAIPFVAAAPVGLEQEPGLKCYERYGPAKSDYRGLMPVHPNTLWPGIKKHCGKAQLPRMT